MVIVFFLQLIASIYWFKGKITGASHINHGKIYGFQLRFSQKSAHCCGQVTFFPDLPRFGMKALEEDRPHGARGDQQKWLGDFQKRYGDFHRNGW